MSERALWLIVTADGASSADARTRSLSSGYPEGAERIRVLTAEIWQNRFPMTVCRHRPGCGRLMASERLGVAAEPETLRRLERATVGERRELVPGQLPLAELSQIAAPALKELIRELAEHRGRCA